jgi:hypothetical protein
MEVILSGELKFLLKEAIQISNQRVYADSAVSLWPML